jgi:hypothetical protein
MSTPLTPTQAGFLAFIRNEMGITTTQLPDNSPSITVAYGVALDIVSDWLVGLGVYPYMLAVYNLAGDRLINYAPDQTGQTFFADARAAYKINSFTAGVIQSAGDQGTSESMLTPEFAKGLTLMDLQNLKTPYGRTYLQFAQSTGTLWGLT